MSYFKRVQEAVNSEVSRLSKLGYSDKAISKIKPKITKKAEIKVTQNMFKFR